MIDAVVLAGGRISGPYARDAGTPIKALARVGGAPMVRRVVEALRAAERVRRICVVGPEPVREVVEDLSPWQAETATVWDNVLAGIERLGVSGRERVLLCGADVPTLDGASIDDFLRRSPEAADVTMPVVRRDHFRAAFPESPRVYIHLEGSAFTGGSQFVVRPFALLENEALIHRLLAQRKSQVGMARTLGIRFLWRLLLRRLSVVELEARLTDLTGCRCRAVLDCHPHLAFDVDDLPSLRYLEGRQQREKP